MIERTITGVNAVISVMGPSGKSKGTPITQGMRYIITAMNRYGVRRLIALSTASSKDPNDKLGIKLKTMITFVKTTSPDAYADIVLSLIHISEPTRLGMISYAVFCLK